GSGDRKSTRLARRYYEGYQRGRDTRSSEIIHTLFRGKIRSTYSIPVRRTRSSTNIGIKIISLWFTNPMILIYLKKRPVFGLLLFIRHVSWIRTDIPILMVPLLCGLQLVKKNAVHLVTANPSNSYSVL